MLKEYMTTTEAAEYKGYTPEHVCYLCSKGKLQGVERIGKKMWIIPRKSIEDYKPGLQGQAAVNVRKEAEKETQLAEWNAAIEHFSAMKLTSV